MKHHNRNSQLYVTLDHDQTGATSGFADCTVQTSHTSVSHLPTTEVLGKGSFCVQLTSEPST